MAKTWAVKVAIAQEPIYETYLIADGDDRDGRPVGDEFDAMDLATDQAYGDYPSAIDFEVVDCWVEADA